jgi:hypothetical protein
MPWKGWENFTPRGIVGAAPAAPSTGKSKYSSKRVVVDGTAFDSKREAARWQVLQARLKAGEIENLQRQVNFDLTAIARDPKAATERGFQAVGRYRADFTYVERGKFVVEDAKGFRTETYRWKRKHFEIEYGIAIMEV